MKEDKAKRILKSSIINTSDDFTDILLQKLEAEKSISVTKVWSFPKVLATCTVLLFCIGYGFTYILEKSTLFNGLKVSATPVLILFSFSILLSLNYMIRLKNMHTESKGAFGSL